MIVLKCGCEVTNEGNNGKVLKSCTIHERMPYTMKDWKGYKQQPGPGDHRSENHWMEVYDNYG